jgi:hypothetical protein
MNNLDKKTNNYVYLKKYLKYKQKYLDLLKNVGGALNLNNIERPLRVISNTGAMNENSIQFRNQCMLISILDYLRRHGFPELTLTELRYIGGLAGILETEEWDQDNYLHREALRRISEYFKLDINVWSIGSNGLLDQRYLNAQNNALAPRYRVGEGNPNVVNIASYGRHFQYIVGGGIFDNNQGPEGAIDYVPSVLSDKEDKYVPLSLLNENQRELAKIDIELDSLKYLKTHEEMRIAAEILQHDQMDLTDDKLISMLALLEDTIQKQTKRIHSQIETLEDKKIAIHELIEKKELLETQKVIQKTIEEDTKAHFQNIAEEFNLKDGTQDFNSHLKVTIATRKDELQKEIKKLKDEIRALENKINRSYKN